MVVEVEDQPQLEARVRDGQTNAASVGERDGLPEVRVVLRPLDVEDAPALVDLVVAAALDRRLHERQRDVPAGIDLNRERSVAPDSGEALDAAQVVRLRGLTLAEHDDGAALASRGRAPSKIFRTGPSRHPVRPRARSTSA